MMVENAMSVRKLAAGLLTTALTFGISITGFAQSQTHMPNLDPFAFDPEFRWFEPVHDIDLEELKPEKRAPEGWFGTYDRLHLSGSRPETDFSNLQGGEGQFDSGWGHRYEVGYMTPSEDTGWTFTFTEANVNEMFTVRHLAAGQFVEPGDDVDATNKFGMSELPFLMNNLNYQTRFFDENRTINSFAYEAFELNKTWRMTPYHYGGILEPLVGFRYMSLRDHTANQDFRSAVDLRSSIINETIAGATDRLTTDQAVTDNEMFAGQVGFRYMKQVQRFTYTSDFRFFLGGNRSTSTVTQTEYFEAYGGAGAPGAGDEVETVFLYAADPIIERNSEFLIGFDVRGEIGYQLTRMLQIRGGVQLIDLASGVWRGGSSNVSGALGGDKDQDVVMLGATFGISLNH
jgi:Putative beta barrel porin-7 (BBP7)